MARHRRRSSTRIPSAWIWCVLVLLLASTFGFFWTLAQDSSFLRIQEVGGKETVQNRG